MEEIKLNSITYDDLLNIHIICDSDFVPPLSHIVDIKTYCLKLYEKAEIISVEIDKIIAGIIAIYCNDKQSNIAYISSICVKPYFRGKGIGKRMLKKANELAVQKGMLLIRLEVGLLNQKAINLYSENGYVFECKGESPTFMQKLLI